MYIMTHFMKNVLTFLLQYDIYISFCSKFVLGQELPFSFERSLGRRELWNTLSTSTPLLSMDAPRTLEDGSFSRRESSSSASFIG